MTTKTISARVYAWCILLYPRTLRNGITFSLQRRPCIIYYTYNKHSVDRPIVRARRRGAAGRSPCHLPFARRCRKNEIRRKRKKYRHNFLGKSLFAVKIVIVYELRRVVNISNNVSTNVLSKTMSTFLQVVIGTRAHNNYTSINLTKTSISFF